ncbi:MAG: PEP-CTERM sorting domain-containing protein [Armatimonadetes bacterium]|nr:PEP-CTERM sorting domain-containing protein [Armatimonadota bacterium]
MKRALRLSFATMAAIGVLAAQSLSVVTLATSGSTVELADNGADAGMAYTWLLGGKDHLYEERYFFRTSPNDVFHSLGDLGFTGYIHPLANLAVFYYDGFGVHIEVSYYLTGGLLTADLAESVLVQNVSGQTAYFDLIEYDDFDLNQTIGPDTAQIMGDHAIKQWDGNIAINAEVVTAPPATFKEVRGFAGLRNDITGTPGYMLNPANNFHVGDATFGFQWVFELGPNEEFLMSKDKLLVVPEPTTLLAFAGLAALALRKRR